MNDIKKHSVLVVVPCYNAAKYLPELTRRLEKYVCPENLLFVNDGSRDKTLTWLKAHDYAYISFAENRGKGAALEAGIAYAIRHQYRSVLTIDADLQHQPEDIPAFYALDDGQTVIIGTRRMTLKNMPWDRWMTNNLTSLIISIFSSRRIRDSQSGFRLIPISVARAIDLTATRYDYESEQLFKVGALRCAVAEVPISTVYGGSLSYINPLIDTLRYIRQIWKRIWS